MSSKSLNPADYTNGPDRFVNFVQDFLGVEPTAQQKKVLRAVAQNQRTLIWGANGPGKSYITAALKLAFLFPNPDSIVMGTSGSYQQYHDTMWRPLDNMFSRAQRKYGLPGKSKGGNQPILEIDDEWYAKVVSPRDPGELEGRHGSDVLVVIDEADKKYVTEDHFDSAGSSITDLNDKMVAVCNPPDDETNVVYQKKNDPRWQVVELSAFEAHNVQVDAGRLNKPRIEGIVDLITMAGDWEAWNNSSWPRVEDAYPHGSWPGMPEIKNQLEDGAIARDDVVEWLRPGFDIASTEHENRTDLDERWYKRRAGVIPPAGAEAHRPIYTEDVQAATTSGVKFGRNRYGFGVDIGRTGDSTAIVEVRRIEGTEHHALYVRTDQGGKRTHGDNESMIRAAMEDGPVLGACAIDADAEGSGVADQMSAEYAECTRFSGGMKPVSPKQKREFKDRRTEALAMLGQFLREGGKFANTRLEKELFACSRSIQYNRRRSEGRDVYKADSKDAIKDRIGRSPDVLDAAAMAVWAFNEAHERSIRSVGDNERKEISSTW